MSLLQQSRRWTARHDWVRAEHSLRAAVRWDDCGVAGEEYADWLWRRGRLDDSRRLWEAVLAQAQQQGQVALTVRAQTQLAILSRDLGDLPRARAYADHAAAQHTAASFTPPLALPLALPRTTSEDATCISPGDKEGSTPSVGEPERTDTTEINTAEIDTADWGTIWLQRANEALLDDNITQACLWLKRAERWEARQHDLAGLAAVWGARGIALQMRGRWLLSAKSLRRALRIHRQLGEYRDMGLDHLHLARAAAATGRLPRARRHLRWATACFRREGNPLLIQAARELAATLAHRASPSSHDVSSN